MRLSLGRITPTASSLPSGLGAVFSWGCFENDLYQDWLDSLRDRVAKVAIIRRVARMEAGLFGGCKPLRDGVWELKVDVGAGYRVYYAHVGNMVIMLTSSGDKKSQSRDIERAVKLLKDWEKRNG